MIPIEFYLLQIVGVLWFIFTQREPIGKTAVVGFLVGLVFIGWSLVVLLEWAL